MPTFVEAIKQLVSLSLHSSRATPSQL